MKRLLLLLALLGPVACGASEKANTVLIHPGEVVYARFSQSGAKVKLLKVSKAPDDKAQVVLSLTPADPAKKNSDNNLKIENRFAQDVHYQAQFRSLTRNLRMEATVYPVVAGKISLVPVPATVEEVATYAFGLEP